MSDDVASGLFSTYAENKMWDLLKSHDDEVGSHFTGDRKGRSLTDCITYVRKVLIYAYEQVGNKEIADAIRKTPADGVPLALYLTSIGWHAHYWNPDVKNPRDKDSEHPVSYKKVLATGKYYSVPVSGLVVDYNKQDKTPKKELVTAPSPSVPRYVDVPADNMKIFERVSKVKFACCLARGGMHTFLFSYGMVFEVHWMEEGTRLYERSAFYAYGWNSGLLLTPPDSTFTSDEIK